MKKSILFFLGIGVFILSSFTSPKESIEIVLDDDICSITKTYYYSDGTSQSMTVTAETCAEVEAILARF